MNELFNLVFTLVLIILIPYFHECGHYIYAQKYGWNVELIWSKIKIYPIAVKYEYDDSDTQLKTKQCEITLMGILFGLIPIIIFYFIIDLNYFYFIMVAYLVGMCYRDNLHLIKYISSL